MTLSVSNEEVGIRMCILSEFLHSNGKLSINEAYKNLCKEIGHDIITLEDFKFWMNRFENRQFDLGYEKESEQKPKEFSDLPDNVLNGIVQNLDLKSRFALREVSRSFLQFVDTVKLQIDGFRTEFNKDSTVIHFMDFPVQSPGIRYTQKVDDCHLASYGGLEKEVKGRNHLDVAINDMKKFFENPKLRMKCWIFTFRQVDKEFSDAFKVLGVFKSKIYVEEIIFNGFNLNFASSILSLLKPGYLQEIRLDGRDRTALNDFQSLIKMEQWKMANKFNSFGWAFPIESLFHFKRFNVTMVDANVEDLMKIQNILFKNSNFESCLVFHNKNTDIIENYDLEKLFGNIHPSDAEPLTFIRPSRESNNEYFKIDVSWWNDHQLHASKFNFSRNTY